MHPVITASAAASAETILGYPISDDAWRATAATITERKALLLRREGDTEHWLIQVDGVSLAAVWMPGRQTIITIRDPSEKASFARRDYRPPPKDFRVRGKNRSGRGSRHV